jgi:hypothetical protein
VTAAGDPGSRGRLPTLLDEARAASDGEAELVVLDALAAAAARAGDLATTRRWLDEADRCRSGVAHLVDDRDRVDAAYAREVLSTQPA